MHCVRMTRSVVGVMLASTVRLWAGYSCGDTVTVEQKLGTVISPGWVIIGQSTSGPRFFSPHFHTHVYLTLQFLHGAQIGQTVEVLGPSPIPPGWVKVATSGDQGLDRQHYKIRYRIEKQHEADPPGRSGDMPPVTIAPIELDVATLDPHSAEKEKK